MTRGSSRVIVAIMSLCTGSSAAVAQNYCSDVLKFGTREASDSTTLQVESRRFVDAFCSTTENSTTAVRGAQAQASIPLADIPIPLGVGGQYQQKDIQDYRTSTCSNKDAAAKSLAFNRTRASTVKIEGISAWAGCMNAAGLITAAKITSTGYVIVSKYNAVTDRGRGATLQALEFVGGEAEGICRAAGRREPLQPGRMGPPIGVAGGQHICVPKDRFAPHSIIVQADVSFAYAGQTPLTLAPIKIKELPSPLPPSNIRTAQFRSVADKPGEPERYWSHTPSCDPLVKATGKQGDTSLTTHYIEFLDGSDIGHGKRVRIRCNEKYLRATSNGSVMVGDPGPPDSATEFVIERWQNGPNWRLRVEQAGRPASDKRYITSRADFSDLIYANTDMDTALVGHSIFAIYER